MILARTADYNYTLESFPAVRGKPPSISCAGPHSEDRQCRQSRSQGQSHTHELSVPDVGGDDVLPPSNTLSVDPLLLPTYSEQAPSPEISMADKVRLQSPWRDMEM